MKMKVRLALNGLMVKMSKCFALISFPDYFKIKLDNPRSYESKFSNNFVQMHEILSNII